MLCHLVYYFAQITQISSIALPICLRAKFNIEVAMNSQTHTTQAIRATMEHLIERATNYDIDALDTIYHEHKTDSLARYQ